MNLKNQHLQFVLKTAAIFLLCVSCGVSAQPSTNGVPSGNGSYQDLLSLLDEFLEFRDPPGEKPQQIIRDHAGQPIDPVTDYGPAAIATQREKINEFKARLQDMNVVSWATHSKLITWRCARV